MERVDGLDLLDTLDRSSRPGTDETREIVKQLLQAVDSLHARGVIHRDLKLENVMLSPKSFCAGQNGSSTEAKRIETIDFGDLKTADSGKLSLNSELPTCPSVKLIDFDTVEVHSPKVTSKFVMGTDMYIAQEAYSGRYSPASDIYSVGVIAYKLLTGKYPFLDSLFKPGSTSVGSSNMQQTLEAVKNFQVDWSRPPFDTEKDAMELCKWTMAPLDTDRPTAKQALAHPWFANMPGII